MITCWWNQRTKTEDHKKEKAMTHLLFFFLNYDQCFVSQCTTYKSFVIQNPWDSGLAERRDCPSYHHHRSYAFLLNMDR